MRWTVFIIVALLFLVLETSFRAVLRLESVSPSFMAALLVYLSLFAPRQIALWCSLILGVLMDLVMPLQQPNNLQVYLIGPYALGYVGACFMLLQVRSMVFRRRLLTYCIMTAAAMTLVALVTVALFAVRSWLPWADAYYPIEPSALGELGRRLGTAVYSAALAVPLGWLLLQTTRLWGFTQVAPTRGLMY